MPLLGSKILSACDYDCVTLLQCVIRVVISLPAEVYWLRTSSGCLRPNSMYHGATTYMLVLAYKLFDKRILT